MHHLNGLGLSAMLLRWGNWTFRRIVRSGVVDPFGILASVAVPPYIPARTWCGLLGSGCSDMVRRGNASWKCTHLGRKDASIAAVFGARVVPQASARMVRSWTRD